MFTSCSLRLQHYAQNPKASDNAFYRKGNRNIPPDQLINKERAIGKIGKGVKLKKADLTAWQNFKETNLKKGTELTTIDPDRQVWEVETEHESFEAGRAGDTYRNATVSRAVDAETGELLYVKVRSALKDFTPGLQSQTP